jgi:hypothetical protein
VALQDVIRKAVVVFQQKLADPCAGFDLVRDTGPVQVPEAVRTPKAYADLEKRLACSLENANHERLSDVQIEAAVPAANTGGLRVRLHPGRAQELAIWAGGHLPAKSRFDDLVQLLCQSVFIQRNDAAVPDDFTAGDKDALGARGGA